MSNPPPLASHPGPAVLAAPDGRRSPFRLIVVLVLLLAVPSLYFYGAHLRDVRSTYTLQVASWLDGMDARFEAVPLLSAGESALLRRSLNARHVALAQDLGIPPVATAAGVRYGMEYRASAIWR